MPGAVSPSLLSDGLEALTAALRKSHGNGAIHFPPPRDEVVLSNGARAHASLPPAGTGKNGSIAVQIDPPHGDPVLAVLTPEGHVRGFKPSILHNAGLSAGDAIPTTLAPHADAFAEAVEKLLARASS
ncbi:MAG: hypothetical protein VKJ04_09870 [Vampirovibrionales bacterium]|nr:hypothetical protein [Vampirovibrionales bacterium]